MDGIGGKVMVGQGDLKVSSNLNHSMILFLVWGLFFFFFSSSIGKDVIMII